MLRRPNRVFAFPLGRPAAPSIILLVVGLAACSGGGTEISENVVRISGSRSIISTESNLLGRPSAVRNGPDGNIYVADSQLLQVLVFSPEGELLRTMGREGQGPGEFQLIKHMFVAGDTIRVIDASAQKMQVFGIDGTWQQSMDMPSYVMLGASSVTRDGRFATGTMGRYETLVNIYAPDARKHAEMVQAFAPQMDSWDMLAMSREIDDGQIPALFRNNVMPILSEDGSLWAICHGELSIQRYSAAGDLEWTLQPGVAEVDIIREQFFESNRRLTQPGSIAGLSLAREAGEVGGDLMILLNMPDDHPSTFLMISRSGELKRRMVLEDVAGAGSFALDADRDKIYLTIPGRAAVVAVGV